MSVRIISDQRFACSERKTRNSESSGKGVLDIIAYKRHFSGQRSEGKLVQRLGCVFSWQLSVMWIVTQK